MALSSHHTSFSMRLTLLGFQVLLATDSARIAEILSEAFSSRFFYPLPQESILKFYCGMNCEASWDLIMELPETRLLGRASLGRPYSFDLFKCSGGDVVPAGFFSYENSNDLACEPTPAEMFAGYFQRKVLQSLLKRVPSFRIVHAGSLAYAGSGILLLGSSKGGKSTLALSGVLSGMRFLSDDHTTVDLDRGLIHPFPRALRLRQGSCEMIPEIMPFCSGTEVDPVGETRYYFHPEKIREDALGSPTTLTHIIQMNGFSTEPRLVPTNPANMAVTASLADFFPDPSNHLDLVWRWGDLMQRAKSAILHVGHPLKTAELLKSFLEEN